MFLISTKISIIVCTGIVDNYENKTKSTAPELAQKYNINVRSINVSLRQLVKAGILTSQIGGSHAGYTFARNPRLISLAEIITALEGKPAMRSCKDVIADIKCDIDDCSNCLMYSEINIKQQALYTKLESISIYDHYVKSKNIQDEDGDK